MMADPHSFEVCFQRLFDYPPMRWQQRLFDAFARGNIPVALDLPTGLGKTSVMAIWLLARALAGEALLKGIPRRLVYVVDRRAVVDQATEEAEKLRKALNGGASRLKVRLGLDGVDLPISTLRGAFVDNRQWLENPAVPAIVVGTVDMIGSRLLFEGYGVSRRMRPYHAGLLGVDTLVVLDEAHLVPPFEALLGQIAHRADEFGPRSAPDTSLVPPFKLLSLSATGRTRDTMNDGSPAEAFQLADEDFDPLVKQRLAAQKTLTIATVDGANAAVVNGANDAVVNALVKNAWTLSGEGTKPVRCLVYCDRRQDAERIRDELAKKLRPKEAAATDDLELFVGARRNRERDAAKAWLAARGFLAGGVTPTRPGFLIATSAGEVGIDLDADHMVCDLVPWERMVQRLGRVNRRGEGNATIVVVHGDEPKPKKPDEPNESEMRQAVAYRSLSVLGELPQVDLGRDASPGALRHLKLRAATDKPLQARIDAATTPEPLRPALTRALVDAWSMTSLEQHTGRPDIAPWLRGWVEEDPQTTVIWRTHLPLRADRAGWPRTAAEKREVEAFFEAAPAHESEKLETETYRVAEWLQQRASLLLKPKEKAAERPAGEPDPGDQTDPRIEALRRDDIVCLVLFSDGSYSAQFTLEELAKDHKVLVKDGFPRYYAGKIVVLNARLGGLTSGMLDPKADGDVVSADADVHWNAKTRFRVRRVTNESPAASDGDWRFEDDFVLRQNLDGEPLEWLVVEHFRTDPNIEDARSVSGKPQELDLHQGWAELKAQEIARAVGLSEEATEALMVAACLHDEGKRAPRWQRAFRAPHEKDETGAYKIFAKTRGPISSQALDGYRHEFGSLPYAERNVRFQRLSDDWRELVLHLIAAHHGHARPVIHTGGCEDAPPTALTDRAREVALRFARLQKCWGPWGLAWWEALLRAADRQASRDNDSPEAMGALKDEAE